MNHSHVGPAKRSREDDLNQSDSLIYDYAEAYNDLSSRVYQWDTPGTASYDSRGIEGQPLDEEEGSVKIEAPDLVKKPSVKRKPPPPLPIPPQGSLVLDKSCSRCRIRKGQSPIRSYDLQKHAERNVVHRPQLNVIESG